MSKKLKTNINTEIKTNRVYPIKVRLAKPNKFNVDKVTIGNINIWTNKDVEIVDVETLMKLKAIHDSLIIKSDIKESKSEVKEVKEIFEKEKNYE